MMPASPKQGPCRREAQLHGRRRAYVELLKSGVKAEVANAALDDVYSKPASRPPPRSWPKAPRPRSSIPGRPADDWPPCSSARGFDYETIKPVVDRVLGEPEADRWEINPTDSPKSLSTRTDKFVGR